MKQKMYVTAGDWFTLAFWLISDGLLWFITIRDWSWESWTQPLTAFLFTLFVFIMLKPHAVKIWKVYRYLDGVKDAFSKSLVQGRFTLNIVDTKTGNGRNATLKDEYFEVNGRLVDMREALSKDWLDSHRILFAYTFENKMYVYNTLEEVWYLATK